MSEPIDWAALEALEQQEQAPPLVRAEVEALMESNGERIKAFQRRGIAIDAAEVLMTRIRAMLDALIGDMDSQPRLAFELALAHQYATALDATEVEINKAMLAQRMNNGGGIPPTSPGGVILPS